MSSWQEDKVAEAERELVEASNRVEAAKKVYETIVHRMSQELSRFQKERAAEASSVLRSFAVSQVRRNSGFSKAACEVGCVMVVACRILSTILNSTTVKLTMGMPGSTRHWLLCDCQLRHVMCKSHGHVPAV